MLGLDNPIHLLILLAVLLLVFGAKRLPEMGRSLGAGLRGFKESISGEQSPSSPSELSDGESGQPAVAAELAHVRTGLERDIARLSFPPEGDRPVTLGIGEPFTTTVTVSLVFALILTLPIILGQLYGFLLPAFEPHQRQRIRPLLAAIPSLFLAGVMFGYFIVLPATVHFLQNFNSLEFNALVQASQYYKFAATTLLALGLVF